MNIAPNVAGRHSRFTKPAGLKAKTRRCWTILRSGNTTKWLPTSRDVMYFWPIQALFWIWRNAISQKSSFTLHQNFDTEPVLHRLFDFDLISYPFYCFKSIFYKYFTQIYWLSPKCCYFCFYRFPLLINISKK